MRHLLALSLLVTVAACGSDPDPMTACTPGTSASCTCADTRAGAQICNSAGSGYGACECGSPMDGGTADLGPAPVCAAGASQACTCAGGTAGTQTCSAAGTAYGACECSAPTTCTVTQSADRSTFTDSCPPAQICVCPGGAGTCANGTCGGIDGRTFYFEAGLYDVPMLDAAGNCYDDIFTPCNDPPDVLIGAAIAGLPYGPIRATDTPALSGATWQGSFPDSGFTAAVGLDRSYAFSWVDEDTDANDPIGEAIGTLDNDVLRNRYIPVTAGGGNGFDLYILPR